jgi:hypothetical protein
VIKKKARLVSVFHGKGDPMDAAVLFIASRVATRRREVQSEFWSACRLLLYLEQHKESQLHERYTGPHTRTRHMSN